MEIRSGRGVFNTVEDYNKQLLKAQNECIETYLEDMEVEMIFDKKTSIRVPLKMAIASERLANCISMDMSVWQHFKFIGKKIIFKIKRFFYKEEK